MQIQHIIIRNKSHLSIFKIQILTVDITLEQQSLYCPFFQSDKIYIIFMRATG